MKVGLKEVKPVGRQEKTMSFDVGKYRKDFPILSIQINGKPLIYLDNAATSQKPKAVIDALSRYYSSENANIHRGIYSLSEKATRSYEAVREKVRSFIGAREASEIIFVRGATEGINLAAQSWGRTFLKRGDEIVISAMEHHSNIVPWQVLAQEIGAKLRVIPITDEGEILIGEYKRIINSKTKLISITQVSNVLGTVNPVKEMIEIAHARKIPVLIDGAQSVPHMPVDVQDLDCDFFVFSGHKLFGPTGVGVLYGKRELLDQMPPYQAGGDMISSVSFEKTNYNVLPYKFEAGTPHIAGVIGLGAAIDYVKEIGLERIAAYEKELLDFATKELSKVPGLTIIGTAREKIGAVSFVLDGIHAHDVGTVLDQEGIAVRAGHHCAMPLMDRFGVPATARASFAFYNTKDEVNALVRALYKVLELFHADK